MKDNTKLVIVAVFIMLFEALVIVYQNSIIDKHKTSIERIDTVFQEKIEWKHDSIEIYKTIPKYIEKVRVDTVYDKENNPIELITENKKYQDTVSTIAGDTMAVTTYISGINANLDSLKVNLSKKEITKTEIITKYITKKKKFIDHFGIGPSLTGGYDVVNKQWGVVAGISVNYNF